MSALPLARLSLPCDVAAALALPDNSRLLGDERAGQGSWARLPERFLVSICQGRLMPK